MIKMILNMKIEQNQSVKKNQEFYLSGGCSIYAIALNEITKLPLYVAKIKGPSEMETHIFVYDKKLNKGLDASGYFSLDNPSIVKTSKISKKDLLILNKLHLVRITKKEISDAKTFIQKNWKIRKNPIDKKKLFLGMILLPIIPP